jgi:epoxyqueuosine reductase
VVDARRCLAWLVQAEGDFPEEHRRALGDRIYGCDDCQEVCPPNRRGRDVPDADAGGAHVGDAEQPAAWVSLIELLEADDDTLLSRHGRWYIPRRDPRYLRRNALVALGNAGRCDDPAVVAVLDRYVHGADEMLGRHARWAADALGIHEPVRRAGG